MHIHEDIAANAGVRSEAGDGVLEGRNEVDTLVDVKRDVSADAGEVVVGADEEVSVDAAVESHL